MANEVVGIDIVARLDGFREELSKIPDIGGKEARQLASQLSREIKATERAAKRATRAAQSQAKAMSRLTKAVSLGPIIEGAKKLAAAFKTGMERATELDKVAGGTLAASLKELHGEASGLADSFLIELTPALEEGVNFLADVANGARIAARELFGLEQTQARTRAATAEGNKAIRKQAERVGALKVQLQLFKKDSDLSSTSVQETIGRLEGNVRKQIVVLKRLKGELQFGEDLTPTGKPAGDKGKTRKGKDPAAEAAKAAAEAAKRAAAEEAKVADALQRSKLAAEDFAAARIGAEEEIRLESARTREALLADRNLVLESGLSSEEQRMEAIAAFRQAEIDLEAETQDRIREERQRTADSEKQNILEVGKARTSAEGQYVQTAAASLGAIGSLVSTLTQSNIDATEEGTAARKKAMRDAWAAESAVAILTAAVNIPLAVSQALASSAPPANLALAAVSGAAAAIALGAVIAKAASPPAFHSGTSGASGTGLAPDEFQATLRRGEPVLSPLGKAAAGGEAGVDALNRGESSGGATFIMQVNDRTTDVQHAEAIRRPDSPMAVSIAEARPRRVGSARVW